MLVATFGPSTRWLGKTITQENGKCATEANGPFTAQDVLADLGFAAARR